MDAKAPRDPLACLSNPEDPRSDRTRDTGSTTSSPSPTWR